MSDFVLKPFICDSSDPLSVEHEIVSRWVSEALKLLGPSHYYQDLPLDRTEAGRIIFAGNAERSRKFMLAAVAQSRHWDRESNRFKVETGRDDGLSHIRPGWGDVWGRRRQTAAIVFAMMRRSMPLSELDVIDLLNWTREAQQLSSYYYPIKAIARATERFCKSNPVTDALREAIGQAVGALRVTHDKAAKSAATLLEQLAPLIKEVSSALKHPPRPVIPAMAGHPAILNNLKVALGMAPAAANSAEHSQIGPDRFLLRADSPLVVEHQLMSELFAEVLGTTQYTSVDLSGQLASTAIAQKIMGMDSTSRGKLVLAAAERAITGMFERVVLSDHNSWQARYAATAAVNQVKSLGCTFDRAGEFDLLLYHWARAEYDRSSLTAQLSRVVADLSSNPTGGEPSDGERYVLFLARSRFVSSPPLGSSSEAVTQVTNLIGDGAAFYLAPSEKWSVAVNQDVSACSPELAAAWTSLLRHCLGATAAKPSDKWLKTASKLIDHLGTASVCAAMLRWFAKVPSGRSLMGIPGFHGDSRGTADVIQEENACVLRGLLWLTPGLKAGDEMTRAVSVVAQSAYKKVPGVGPRAVKVGNAAVYALSQMHSPAAVGQLAMLKVRVKFGTAQREIEKAFAVAAAALAIPREQIEEMGVPSYGLEEVGLRRETFGEAAVELRVDGREVSLAWTSNGKPVKSVPAKVKADHTDELKELQGAVKDISAMLPAQAERIDSMFLLQKRWPLAAWRERYLDHPLVGTLARRLIWCSGETAFMWHRDRLVDVDDRDVELPPEAEIRLWHPIERSVQQIVAWRQWLERHEVRQPFKQAHREVYPLTDAERRTETYSNRFAGHILRQHQFNSLCATRGWKNKLRLMVDDSYPPASRELLNWGLRAEFWVEGAGDGYGQDTNDAGAFLRVSTDQVRFYRTGAAINSAHAGGGGYTTHAQGPGDGNRNEPIALQEVPALVLSEIMRDVDLFVGVGSVGNDPAWQDGGPGGRYREYWQSYSFGELSETAQTRKAVLQTLLPRLTKLRDRWTLADRFLVIRGELRVYKIHLGSGNILMEPDDRYLCIVPDRSKANESFFLPFEGDSVLSVILSKAFLLAADTKITDPTIKSQIRTSAA